jgi:hypothetical protein
MTSLLGVMRFPNDLEKAAAYASWCLAKGIEIKPNDAATIDIERILPILNGTARQAVWHEESNRNEIAGTAAGEVVKTLFALIGGDPSVASWKHAINLMELAAARDRVAAAARSADTKPRQKAPAVSRATLHKYLREFSPVLHLWGAYATRAFVEHVSARPGERRCRGVFLRQGPWRRRRRFGRRRRPLPIPDARMLETRRRPAALPRQGRGARRRDSALARQS